MNSRRKEQDRGEDFDQGGTGGIRGVRIFAVDRLESGQAGSRLTVKVYEAVMHCKAC